MKNVNIRWDMDADWENTAVAILQAISVDGEILTVEAEGDRHIVTFSLSQEIAH